MLLLPFFLCFPCSIRKHQRSTIAPSGIHDRFIGKHQRAIHDSFIRTLLRKSTSSSSSFVAVDTSLTLLIFIVSLFYCKRYSAEDETIQSFQNSQTPQTLQTLQTAYKLHESFSIITAFVNLFFTIFFLPHLLLPFKVVTSFTTQHQHKHPHYYRHHLQVPIPEIADLELPGHAGGTSSSVSLTVTVLQVEIYVCVTVMSTVRKPCIKFHSQHHHAIATLLFVFSLLHQKASAIHDRSIRDP